LLPFKIGEEQLRPHDEVTELRAVYEKSRVYFPAETSYLSLLKRVQTSFVPT